MKIIVIGAAGLAGSAIVRRCTITGHEVLPITRDNYAANIGAKADFLINANGNSAKYLATRDPVGEIERSVTSVLKTCLDFSFDRYVLLSSADVYPCQDDPAKNHEECIINPTDLNPYGLCKYFAEQVLCHRVADACILRCGGLIGPGLRKNPIYDLLTGSDLYVHDESSFGFIHVDKVAEIAATLANDSGSSGIWNVCGTGLVSIRELKIWCGRENVKTVGSHEPIRYDICNRKLLKSFDIPESAVTVRDFIASWPRTE